MVFMMEEVVDLLHNTTNPHHTTTPNAPTRRATSQLVVQAPWPQAPAFASVPASADVSHSYSRQRSCCCWHTDGLRPSSASLVVPAEWPLPVAAAEWL